MPYYISPDIFLLEKNNNYIIYAPLKGLAFLVDPPVINLLNEFRKNKDFIPEKAEMNILNPFVQSGLMSPVPIRNRNVPKNQMAFMPTSVTLFLTNNCNMRCTYCYASAGEGKTSNMSFLLAKAAVDFITMNAIRGRIEAIDISFHGGGEPTVAWSVLKKTVEYAQQTASENKLDLTLSLASNGVILPRKLEWIMKNFHGLNLSFDGPEDIQDKQRMLSGGKGSFRKVMDSVNSMNSTKFPYDIRVTVTDESVTAMGRIMEFFIHNCRARTIHFEPAYSCGRCLHNGIKPPSPDQFIQGYRKVSKIARENDINVAYSGTRLRTITSIFCKATGDSFCVTPTGDITSCYEVCSREDPRSEVFFYGRFDYEKEVFILDKDKLAYLSSRTVHNIPHCKNCFCKYHCAGDCIAKSTDGIDLLSIKNSTRCQINQALTLDRICEILHVN